MEQGVNTGVTQKNALISMVLCGLCWSTSSLFIKLIPWSSFQLVCIRGALAGTFLLSYVLFVLKKKFVFSRQVAIVSVFVCFKYIGFISANKLTTAANCVAILQSNTVLVLLANCFIDKKIPKPRDIAVILAVLFGISLFFYGQFDLSSMVGNLLAFLAAVCTAVLFYASGKFKTVEENLSSIIMGNFLSSFLAFFLIVGDPLEISVKSISTVLFLAFVQQGISFVLYTKAVRVISPFACAIIGAIEPVLSPILCLIFLAEKPSQFATVGTVVVIGSIIVWSIATFKSGEKNKTAA